MIASQTEIAWLAGFLDGEGTIGLHRANSKKWPHPYLAPHLQAPNTDLRLIERARDIIERITGVRPWRVVASKAAGRCKMSWRFMVKSQRQLAVLLPALIPHLISKHEQAEIVLQFVLRREGRMRKRWYQYKELDEAAYLQCLALNKRGLDAPEPVTSPAALSLVVNE